MPRMSGRKSQFEDRDESYANENYPQSRNVRNRMRDEEGRFMSEEERGYSRSSRNRGMDYEESGRRSSRMPARDEEGRFMSEDEEEGYYSGRSRGSSSGGRRYASSSRSQGDWFGDPEGHSR